MRRERNPLVTCDLCEREIADYEIRFKVERVIPATRPDGGFYDTSVLRGTDSKKADVCLDCGDGVGLSSMFDGTARKPTEALTADRSS